MALARAHDQRESALLRVLRVLGSSGHRSEKKSGFEALAVAIELATIGVPRTLPKLAWLHELS